MTKQAEQTQQTEVVTNKEVQQPTAEEQAAAQEAAEASFSAGVNRVRGVEAPKKEEVEPEPAKAETTTTEAPAQADADPIVLAGLTEPQLKATLAKVGELTDRNEKLEKQLRQVFGKFGDIQAQLTAANAGLSKREINAESFKRLKADYPELAESISADMAEVLAGTPASGPGITQSQVDEHVNKVVSERVAEAVAKVNEDMLTRFHSDWQAIAQSDDLQLWLGTQPVEYRNKFLGSTSATEISAGLDKFKSWREQSQATRQQSTRRLENAIAPTRRSAPGAPPASDHAAFLRGVNRVRGG